MAMLSYSDVRWGIDACSIEGCYNDAELIIEPLGWLTCIDCADKIIERRVLTEQYGSEILRNAPEIGEWYQKDCEVKFLLKETDV